MTDAAEHVIAQVRGCVGCITLNRAEAFNALSLEMVRSLTRILLNWQKDEKILAVAIRGNSNDGPFGLFCSGGDIRFLHTAGSRGDPQVEDFFTEEYALDHLIHNYGKPYIAFMDGIVMGGGMGISQGAALRVVTENTKMAMPETGIGLFPDVGGGYFLSRSPGRAGEWLAMTGEVIGAGDALAFSLADGLIPSGAQAAIWEQLGSQSFADGDAVQDFVASKFIPANAFQVSDRGKIDQYFGLKSVGAIIAMLEAESGAWEQSTAATLRKRSPLMLHVALEQIRRGRSMSLADNLRMERGMVRHCFHLRPGQSETLEGIRALAVDKDKSPKWNPIRIEDVTAAMWQPFFTSPWPEHAHPLARLV